MVPKQATNIPLVRIVPIHFKNPPPQPLAFIFSKKMEDHDRTCNLNFWPPWEKKQTQKLIPKRSSLWMEENLNLLSGKIHALVLHMCGYFSWALKVSYCWIYELRGVPKFKYFYLNRNLLFAKYTLTLSIMFKFQFFKFFTKISSYAGSQNKISYKKISYKYQIHT